MTLPDERYRAIQAAGALLLRIAANPKETPGIPRQIRDQARAVLRHYPTALDLQRLEQACPEVVQQQMEPLHRMVTSYQAQTPEHESHTAAQSHGDPP